MKVDNIFNFNSLAIFFLLIGYFFVNFAFLDNDLRRTISFAFFFLAIAFSLKSNFLYLMAGRMSINHLIGVSVLIYSIAFTTKFGTVDEYGSNKYQYFLLIITIAFISIPHAVNNEKYINKFVFLFVGISLIYCLIAILFASSDGGRRGESGLNPAILARLCMLTGLYGFIRIYVDGINITRVGLIIVSCVAVLFTGTKTPFPVAVATYLLITVKADNILLVFKSILVVIVVSFISYLSLKYVIPESISSRILDLESLSLAAQFKEGSRFELYNLALYIISEEPQGLGFGGFAIYHRFIIVPHNIFLENAIEMGVVSAVVFMVWAFWIFRIAMKSQSKNVNYMFINAMYIYMLISLMFGGEMTIQSLFLYLSGSIILLNYKRFNRLS